MRDRVVEVMASVLAIAPEQVTESMAFGRTKNWDSLAQMNLIMALEDEFQIKFTDQEVIELLSLPLIVAVLGEKIPG